MRPRIGGLFFGYGGLDLAVQAVLGGDLTWYAEVDPGACKIAAHRFPGVPNIGDVTAVDWSATEPVDVLTGGSPCQDLSTAGRRRGMTEGTRSNLWAEMREAIATLRPGLVVWENVRGAYTAHAASSLEFCPGCMGDPGDARAALRALGRVLGDLSDLGYDAIWHGLRAADVGAPHARFRVFVIAYPRGTAGGATGAAAGVPLAAGPGRAPLTLLPTPKARDWKGFGTAELRRHAPDLSALPLLLPTPTTQDSAASGGSTPSNVTLTDAVVRTRMGTRTNERLLPTPAVADVQGGRKSRSGGRSGELLLNGIAAEQRWGPYAEAIEWWAELTRPAPAPTEPSPRGRDRLSPRFSEWMMGLPNGWVTDVPGITRNEALKACGNGVVPQQAAEAVRVALAHLQAVAA